MIDTIHQMLARSVPLVAVSSHDPSVLIDQLKQSDKVKSLLVWTYTEGAKAIKGTEPGSDSAGNPIQALTSFRPERAGSVLVVTLANRVFNDFGAMAVQAVWDLRDFLKHCNSMVILIGQSIQLPPELVHDVQHLDEPLPDDEDLGIIVRETLHAAFDDKPQAGTERVHELLRGVTAFAAEQLTALACSKAGFDTRRLIESKRKQIEQTPGLKLFRGRESFESLGGVVAIKTFCHLLMTGRDRPRAVVFLDEIEKMLAGSAGDMSGVSQDQLGTILSHMQDTEAVGMIFVGPPGSAKSAVAKAIGNEAEIPTVQLDLGGLKGSLLGQSEAQLRHAIKTIDAISGGKTLWVATCNKITTLPPELRRRFTLGTWFFDLPDGKERAAIWDIWMARFGIVGEPPHDEGWTGAEIRSCCHIAWQLNISLDKAAAFIVPVCKSAPEKITELREQARGRFLSASKAGVYQVPEIAPAKSKRKFAGITDDT